MIATVKKTGMLTYSRLGKYGKFGNQLFQIASTIGISEKKGVDFGFPKWGYQDYFINPLPELNGEHKTLDGYLQDYRNFDHCKELIRHYFEMKPLAPVRLNTVFIHYRDYENEGVSDVHPVQTKEYYKEAIKHFPGKKFMVFSDNIKKARDIIGMNGIYSTGTDMNDFYIMSHCDGGIISNSSYSWWAAWLCGGKVVIPSNWFTGRKKDRDTSGFYLPNWIKL